MKDVAKQLLQVCSIYLKKNCNSDSKCLICTTMPVIEQIKQAFSAAYRVAYRMPF